MTKAKTHPRDLFDDSGDIDDYTSHDEFVEDIQRAALNYRGRAYQSNTDDSSYYDGETYGYED